MYFLSFTTKTSAHIHILKILDPLKLEHMALCYLTFTTKTFAHILLDSGSTEVRAHGLVLFKLYNKDFCTYILKILDPLKLEHMALCYLSFTTKTSAHIFLDSGSTEVGAHGLILFILYNKDFCTYILRFWIHRSRRTWPCTVYPLQQRLLHIYS